MKEEKAYHAAPPLRGQTPLRTFAAASFAALVFIALGRLDAEGLRVSDNGRFLARSDGSPFFYLGDTAWELFHRLNRKEAALYLDDRAEKGFTVIQAVALAELDGLNIPNPYGHRPLRDNDPARPDVIAGGRNDYWDHVEYVVDQANARGLTMGLLPTWGDKWNKKWGVGPVVFTPENARAYGEFLGRRFGGKDLIWILGGDRPIEADAHRAIINAMAEGIQRGDRHDRLMTFHPNGPHSSAEWFHDAPWLDFNMRQNGHDTRFTEGYAGTLKDYQKTPIKPVFDGEPVYEDHPVGFKPDQYGHTVSADIRRPLYWDLFSGAFGHTYGHHSIWQMWSPKHKGVNYPLMSWRDALDQPGASQMIHGRRLMESRPFFSRIPDDAVIATGAVPTAVPGAGSYRLKATRDKDGGYAMAYTPSGRPFAVDMSRLSGERIRAWWFNPRDGGASEIGVFPNARERARTFTPPTPGEMLDWVLVLDDAEKGYPPPGAVVSERQRGRPTR